MFPAISSLPQFVATINERKLEPGLRHYNASIVDFEGDTILAYRHDDALGRSRVLLHRLGKSYAPKGEVLSPLMPAEGQPSAIEHEDPRLFVAGGKLYLAYIALNGRHRDGLFTQELVQLDAELGVARSYDLRIGRNGTATEKNWIFFDAGDGRIGIVYSLKPHRVFIISSETGEVLEQYETPGIGKWHFGTLSGGTPALRVGEDFLHIFHSYVPHNKRGRRYSLSAAIFRGVAPYDCLLVSDKPLVWASEWDRAVVNPRRPGWNPLCIFPSGLIGDGQSVTVSCGINDTSIALLTFTEKELRFVAPAATSESAALQAGECAAAPAGAIRVRVTSRENKQPRSLAENGQRYVTGDEFHTTPERAAQLGALVEVIA